MYKDKSVLNSFAKIAAKSYIKEKTPLNSSLKKLAMDEGLSPEQIQYVAAESNKEVWKTLYDADKKSGYSHDLADAAHVIDELQIKTASRVINESEFDYNAPPSSIKDGATLTKAASAGIEKTAEEKAFLKKELQSRLEKLALAKDEIFGEKIACRTRIENLELAFVKEARTMIIQEGLDGRSAVMDTIGEFVRGAEVGALGKELMHKLSYVVKKQGLMKEADLKAPDQYISEKLPARILNGRHSLFITIKTLSDEHKRFNDLEQKSGLVDDTIPTIREKIREL